jgi:hypothetical protein
LQGSFVTYIVNPSQVMAVHINAPDSGLPPVMLPERINISSAGNRQEEIEKALFSLQDVMKKKGVDPDEENDVCVVVSSAPLVKAGVFGVTEEWSMNLSLVAASSMMLDVQWAYSLMSNNFQNIDENVKTVLVSGGYDGSFSSRIDQLMRTVSQMEWLRKKKPLVIFRGSRNAIDAAKLYFSPFTGFLSLSNVLAENPLECSEKIENIIESIYLSECDLSDKIKKNRLFVFSSIITKISQLLCSRNVSHLGTYFINEKFSVFYNCEKKGGKHIFRKFSIPKDSSDIVSSDYSKGYGELIDNSMNSFSDTYPNNGTLLSLPEENTASYYRPMKIVGIVVDSATSFERFLNLISDPDALRGKIEFVFDDQGYLPALSAMYMRKDFDQRTDVSDIVEDIPVKKGWIIIPDGKFEKDKEAVSLYVSGTTKIEPVKLNWGKRYTYEIAPSSSIEISLFGKVFLSGIREKTILLKTNKSPRTLIVDLRKERS